MTRRSIPGPYDPAEMRRFLDTFLYEEDGILIDEVISLDAERREVRARLDTTRFLPIARHQRVRPDHPAHVSGGELIIVTWFFHGVRWDEGWVGYGNRIHRADFRELARIGPVLELRSRETRARIGARRIMLRFEFQFWQGDTTVYYGDQSALFIRDARLD
jgi:hypothetical protein